MKVKGLEEASAKFADIARRAEKLDGTTSVPLDELLSTQFLSKHTSYGTVDEFFAGGGFKVESNEDLEAIPQHELDTYVAGTTAFSSWDDLLTKAAEEWTVKKLGL